MNNNRDKTISAAAHLALIIASPEPVLATWHIAREAAYQKLLRAAAEESPIVKAARVLIRGRLLLGEALPANVTFQADLELLEAKIADVGDPPYASSTEDDSWVERIRSELRERA